MSARTIELESRDSPAPAFVITKVETHGELEEVYRLTHDCYLEQGYCAPQPSGRLVHYPHLDNIPETMVFVAMVDGRIVASNSLTLDGPRGLHVDEDFKEECDLIRREDRRLASSWRIVTHKSYRADRKIILGLIEETVRQAIRCGVETCVFTFNPCHERVYKRLLNMDTVARRDTIQGLSNAPAVLMRCDFERLPARWLSVAAARSPLMVPAATQRGIGLWAGGTHDRG